MEYVVLSAKPYNFENSKGENVKGVKIAYVNKRKSIRKGEYGNPPMITSCSSDMIDFEILESLPAICEMDFEQVTGKNNKPELLLVEMNLISSLDFNSLG